MSDEQQVDLQTQQPVEQAQTQETVATEQPAQQTEQGQIADAPKKTLTQEEVDKVVAERVTREKSAREKLELENFQMKQHLQQMQQQHAQYQPQQDAWNGGQQHPAQHQAQQIDYSIMQAQAKAYQSEQAMRQKAQDYDAVMANPWLQHGINHDRVFLTAVSEMEDPSAFVYEAAKNHSEKLQKIITNPNPVARFKDLIALEFEMKHKAQTQKVTQAPAPMKEETGNANYAPATSPDAIMEERRKARGR